MRNINEVLLKLAVVKKERVVFERNKTVVNLVESRTFETKRLLLENILQYTYFSVVDYAHC